MGERETCAACGLPRATRDDLAALAPECRRHAGCSACDGVRLCWHDRADHCAETRGGWPAIVAAARAEAERLRTAAADERADVVAYMSRVAANLRRQRPRTDYLDTEADTYERASDAIADECHVGAAKGGE